MDGVASTCRHLPVPVLKNEKHKRNSTNLEFQAHISGIRFAEPMNICKKINLFLLCLFGYVVLSIAGIYTNVPVSFYVYISLHCSSEPDFDSKIY